MARRGPTHSRPELNTPCNVGYQAVRFVGIYYPTIYKHILSMGYRLCLWVAETSKPQTMNDACRQTQLFENNLNFFQFRGCVPDLGGLIFVSLLSKSSCIGVSPSSLQRSKASGSVTAQQPVGPTRMKFFFGMGL